MPPTTVSRVLYEVNSRTLAVAFTSGAAYIYQRPSDQLVDAFQRAQEHAVQRYSRHRLRAGHA